MKNKNFCLKKASVLKVITTLLMVAIIGTVAGLIASQSGESNATSGNITPVPDNKNAVEVRFLNTNNDTNNYVSSQSIILKTYDDKYILIDAPGDTKDMIYNALRQFQCPNTNNCVVEIDYFIISHFHGDHMRDADKLINDANKFSIKNIIMKYEATTDSANNYKYSSVANAANASGINIIQTNELDEGHKIDVGDYLTLYLYNTSDIYNGKDCSETGKRIDFFAVNADNYQTASSGDIVKINNKYLYIDGAAFIGKTYPDYPEIHLMETSSIITKTDRDTSNPLDKYFYAYYYDGASNCNSNGNSVAVFAEIKNNTNDKYMYFPGDLENTGVSIKQKENNVTGNGDTVIYKNVQDFYDSVNHTINESNIDHPVYYAAETQVAYKIQQKFGKSNLADNLTIYQAAHHGYNNAPDAIDKLQVDNTSTYSVATIKSDPAGSRAALKLTKYANYTLKNATKLYVGGGDNGVNCVINGLGITYCGYDSLDNITTSNYRLNYDTRDGSSISGQSCTIVGPTTESCSITITSDQPTRSGYTFGGWADSPSGDAEYQPGDEISLSSNKTLYAVWTPEIVFDNPSDQINVTYDENATMQNKITVHDDWQVTYSSSDTNIATVDSTGLATIKKTGVVNITADVAASADHKAASASYQLTIEKQTSAAPEEISTAKIGYITDKLSAITFETTGIVWQNGDLDILSGRNTYKVNYTKNADTENYTTETFDVVVEGISRQYNIIEGSEQTYTLGDAEYIRFRIDADYNKFENGGEVYVDNERLEANHYSTESGSTIINISNEYLEQLEAGKHNLYVHFNDGGLATTAFYIEREGDVPVPDTDADTDTKTDTNTDKSSKASQDEDLQVPDTGTKQNNQSFISVHNVVLTILVISLAGAGYRVTRKKMFNKINFNKK